MISKCKAYELNDEKIDTLLNEKEIKCILKEKVNIVSYKLEK